MRIKGMLRVDVFECPLTKIETTSLTLSTLQRGLRIGTIHMTTATTPPGAAAWEHISQPLTVHTRLRNAIARSHKNGCGGRVAPRTSDLATWRRTAPPALPALPASELHAPLSVPSRMHRCHDAISPQGGASGQRDVEATCLIEIRQGPKRGSNICRHLNLRLSTGRLAISVAMLARKLLLVRMREGTTVSTPGNLCNAL